MKTHFIEKGLPAVQLLDSIQQPPNRWFAQPHPFQILRFHIVKVRQPSANEYFCMIFNFGALKLTA